MRRVHTGYEIVILDLLCLAGIPWRQRRANEPGGRDVVSIVYTSSQ